DIDQVHIDLERSRRASLRLRSLGWRSLGWILRSRRRLLRPETATPQRIQQKQSSHCGQSRGEFFHRVMELYPCRVAGRVLTPEALPQRPRRKSAKHAKKTSPALGFLPCFFADFADFPLRASRSKAFGSICSFWLDLRQAGR